MKRIDRLCLAALALAFVATFGNASKVGAAEREIYIPQELRNQDWNDADSKWSFARSKSSEHCVVFWEKGFGENPNAEDVPENMRVDVDDLLAQAEKIYQVNVEKLGFGGGKEPSQLEKYKLEIYLCHTADWLATGSGYDNTIGALWVSPATCHPVGDTIGHELGHAFQYQVSCDRALNGADPETSGFRYAHDGGFGNTIWEQCAQWQAFRVYPEQVFTWFHRETWAKNCHRAVEHEWMRYQSYWIFFALKDLKGAQVVSDVWKRSERPEDFLGAYMRLYCNRAYRGMGTTEYPDGSPNLLYRDLYYYASHAATFDFEGVPAAPEEWLDSYRPNMIKLEDGSLQVAFSSCPSETGFNVIPLDPKDYGEKIVAELTTLPIGSPLAEGDPGEAMQGGNGETVAEHKTTYNDVGRDDDLKPIHLFGFVALRANGVRVYGGENSPFVGFAEGLISKFGGFRYGQEGITGSYEFRIPEDTKRLFFVVLGAANRHVLHKWDDDERNDVQLPYKVKFSSPDHDN